MHPFDHLTEIAVRGALTSISEEETRILIALQSSGATSLVMGMQAQKLRRVILVTGMFSILEADLQDTLNCKNGFEGAMDVLLALREDYLLTQLRLYKLAINVLKHGRGTSYETLLGQISDLPFRLRPREDTVFCEGDVGEVNTLIDVDDTFVLGCVRIVCDVKRAVGVFINSDEK